jgi:hypothetical protein
MMARDRRYARGRRSVLKTRAGLVTAVLACGALAAGGVALAAATGSGHAAALAASPAAYSARSSSEGAVLKSALGHWSSSRQASYSELASLTQAPGYSQAKNHGQTLDIQRGIVILATSNYLIVQSANGSLHLWVLSGATQFQDVAGSTAGTLAMTASPSATQQAMTSGNMIPATTMLAGSPVTAAALLTPGVTQPTMSVQVANTDLTVTVTVTRGTAVVSQTATTPSAGAPAPDQTMFSQSAWQATDSVARGDLVVMVGVRSNWTLHADLVLFTPLSAMQVGGATGGGVHW